MYVSVDCGKGNTYHKVHGFVGCFISYSDDFQGAIDHINNPYRGGSRGVGEGGGGGGIGGCNPPFHIRYRYRT